ncbi:ribonuclease E [Marinicauda pacifica]|uniref:Ribonuclease E n=1 Tax=Marinicauda pacifica TaxID=1133559 RepID=A0A4S2HE91_9PROT|nr:ribonuclease E/G [Marinicauda pacifica]TGY94380.1 Rne/Rng family ribonuclease [Marinicauda pacifica]GGE35319.1 ribonuclease E [Marinicauda pacifica]
MPQKMLIDAGHPEETRVVLVDSNRVEDFDFESSTKKQIRGNIYLAKVTRVEPSLQACFVEYGGNKHGFLAFNEIHPDYYQIPFEDREKLREAEAEIEGELNADPIEVEDGETESVGNNDDDEIVEEAARKRRQLLRKYKIQEVIKRRQVLLVQVAKEERGNKGAALTTYLSLAGRYCVLMPNTARGGGISRKIAIASDRKRLKSIVNELEVPQGMGLIIRTAGASRTKLEVKRDYEYLIRLWETIRELTLQSTAPTLIYEEGNLVKRAIRDLYDKDIEEVLVEGEEAYKEAKAFMRMLMPSHAKKVQHYRDDTPLFQRHQVESQLEAIYSPIAQLKSGGYIVINPTEALVSIDVNSGRATKERNIEQTALKTNMEAAEEAARQMRLRDLAGLLVIDFIDMDENKNVRAVEKKMKDALKKDRARIQVGRISQFGLMEMSRQRRRTSLMEGSTQVCSHCGGSGFMRSVESSALLALRTLEEEGLRGRTAKVELRVPMDVALYLLNEKRESLHAIEARFDMKVIVTTDETLIRPHLTLDRLETRKEAARARAEARAESPAITEADIEPRVQDVSDDDDDFDDVDDDVEDEADETADSDAQDDTANARERSSGNRVDGAEDDGSRKRRRRGRRGGRGRRRRGGDNGQNEAGENAEARSDSQDSDMAPRTDTDPSGDDVLAVVEPVGGDDLTHVASDEETAARKRPSRRRSRAKTADDAPADSSQDAEAKADETPADRESGTGEDKPKRRRRRRKPAAETAQQDDTTSEAKDETSESQEEAQPVSDVADQPDEAEKPAKPKRTRRKPAASKAKPDTSATEETTAAASDEAKAATEDETGTSAKPAPKKRTRKKPAPKAKPETETETTSAPAPAARTVESQPAPAETRAEPAKPEPAAKPAADEGPKKRGWWQRSGKLFGLGND